MATDRFHHEKRSNKQLAKQLKSRRSGLEFLEERHAIGSLLPFFPGGSFLPSFNQNALSEGSCEFDAKSFCVSQSMANENEATPVLSLPAFPDSSISSAPLQASAPSPRPYFNDVEQMNLAQQGASPIDAGLYTSVEVASLDPFLESDCFSDGISRVVGSSVLATPNETYFSENMPDATLMAPSGLGASDTPATVEDLFADAPVRNSATPPTDGAFASNGPDASSTPGAPVISAEPETELAASDTVAESTLISTVEIPAASDAQTELIISSGAVSTPVNLASPQVGSLISRVESFPDDLSGWNVDVFDAREQGGSVEVQDGKATMREGDSFATSLKRVQTVPQGAVQFQFSYDSLSFDSTSNGRMKDSFEAALVDSDGYSLVGGWAPGRDAFFNVSEGTSAATSSGVSIDVRGGVTTVTVDLDETAAGRDAAVVFRLANNDGDSASSVRLLSSGFIIFSENTEPVVSASDIAGQEGSPVSLVARFSDENPDDTHVAYVNWGDGSPETELSVTEANGSGMAVGTHVYADNGAYGVSVRVVDQKNGVGRVDLTAQIANVAPTVEASADFAAVWDGERYVLEATVFGSFSDPGFDNPLTGTSETFTAALDWGDGTVETLPLDVVPGSEGTPSTGSFRATRVISSDGLHDLKVSVTDDDGGVGEATVSFVSSIIDVKPAVRDRLNADDLLEDATLLPRGYYPVVIGGTDAFNPSTVDVSSLEFGPGAALEMNQQFVYADADRLGAPKDGVLDAVAHFRAWDALLTDSDEIAWLKGRTVDGTTFIGLGTLTVAALSARIPFAFDESFPRLRGSSTDSETPTKFFVVDNANDQTFRYSADGGANGSFGMPTDVYNVRGIAASADGSTLWTVDAGTKAVSVYSADGSRLGEWTAADVVSPEGVSVWNDDLWIVDATTSQVRYYQGGAIAREGAYSATSTFTLDRANRHASDLVVGESLVWVVDDYRDSAFVYTFDGACVGSWSLDPENANASGVTLDPTGASTDLWVVDRADAVVYRYAFAQEYLDPDSQHSLSAPQAYAADSFALAANNRRPEGIADPAPYAADDSETNASTNEITVELTAPRQALTGVPTGTVFTLSGSAASTTTLESGVSYREKITAVYVNGKAVDALDENGRFFANVSIVGGTNEFNVEVIDRSGRKESRVFTVVGSDAGEMKFDVSDAFQPMYAQTSFNESSHKVYARLAIKNDGQFSASKPFYVGVTNISDARVTLRDYAGIYDGVCYYDYSDLVGDDVFAPTKATGYVDATFYNPSGVSFTYDLVYLTAVNDAPIFDSVPRVDAYAGKTYVYEASAVDGDGDRLVYSLNAAPDGAQIDAKTGVVSWTPSEDQLGNFELEIQVEDGRGGVAIQQFTVTSTVAPTNRPPVITSTPTLSATISSTSPGQKMGDVYPDFILFDDAADVFNTTISISLDDLSTGIGSADVIFVVDESGSMSGEHRWLQDLIFDLDETLTAQGVVDNRYGLVGYVSTPRPFPLSGDQYTLMTASEFSVAAKTLSTGRIGWEDGYNGLHAALDNYTFRENAVPIVVLVTDDQRWVANPDITYSSIHDEFVSKDVLLHGVFDANFAVSGYSTVLGVDYRGNAFVPSTESATGYIVVEGGSFLRGIRETKSTYVDLVWDEQIQGTSWDLNILKNGGVAAQQFSRAFVDYLTKDVIRRVPITISVDPGVQGVVNLSGDQTFKTGDAAATFEVQIDTALAPDYFYVYFDNAETGERLGAIPAFFKGDGLYVYDVDAYDPDYDELTYTLVESPEGMWIEPSSGLILWSPDYGQHGEHNVKVEVSDGRGGVATQEFVVTVVDDMNTAPMIITEPITEITVDDAQTAALEDRVVAVDADGDEIVYTLVEAPAGMTIDSTTGVLLWNPTANDAGMHTVSVQASDGRGGVYVQTYELNVKERGSSSISGYVFDDENQNGVQDEGETFLSGQIVWLDQNRNGKLDVGERKTTSDANGYYCFDELDAGTYYVRYLAYGDYVQTFPLKVDDSSFVEPQDWTVEKPVFNGDTITVTTASDVVDENDGATSLREAIQQAQDGDVIVFDSSLKDRTITLNGTQLEIAKSVKIDASALYDSANKKPGITIDANKQSRVFYISDGFPIDGVPETSVKNVAILGLTITGGNVVGSGGGICSFEDLTLVDCLITGNHCATVTYCHGGGVYSGGAVSTLRIDNSVFTNNSSEDAGGAVGCTNLVAINSSFYDNHTTNSGGAVAANGETIYGVPELNFKNCLFSSNSSGGNGGAVNTQQVYASYYSCEFYDNVATGESQYGSVGGAIFGQGEQSIFDCSFVGNKVIANSSLSSAYFQGGAAVAFSSYRSVATHIDRCIFKDNSTTGEGGAILGDEYHYLDHPNCDVSNSVFINNSANSGGAVQLSSGCALTATNSTFVDNVANTGSEFYSNGSMTLRNSIVIDSGSSVLYGDVSSDKVLSSSETIASISGNFSYDESKPLFNDPANGDYSLTLNSQAIDRGADYYAFNATGEVFQYDVSKNKRFSGKSIDLGAYEWSDETIPDGYVIVLGPKQSVTNRDFGAYQKTDSGSISGYVFDDANQNGVQDENETYLTGHTVWLDQNQNGRLDVDERLTISDENGFYRFDGLEPGTYYVRYLTNGDYIQTFPLKGGNSSSFEPQDWTVEKPVFNGDTITVTTASDAVDENDGATSLREALLLAQDGDVLTFDASLKGKTITLNGSQLDIAKSVMVDASALYDSANKKPGIAIDANKQSRVFEVNDGDSSTKIEVVLVGLTITGGNARDGGGVVTNENLTLLDSLIKENVASDNGAGVQCGAGTTLTVDNCEFVSNTSNYASGGIGGAGVVLNVSNSSFVDNVANRYGGAVYLTKSEATFHNSRFNDNVANYCGGAVFFTYGQSSFYSCQFNNNLMTGSYYDPHGGGAICCSEDSGFYAVDCSFIGNKSNASSQPWSGGGAIHLNFFDSITTRIDRCLFKDNTTLGKGGAIYVRGYQECEVSNSVFINNTANSGGAVHLYAGGTLSATNSTFAYNAANSGSEFYADGSLTLRNSIVVGSGSDLLWGRVSADKVLASSESIASGANNFIYNETKPLFNDIANGDYSLAPNSQAIDKGDDYYAVDSNGAAFQYDLAQNRRFSGKSVDLGAYEWINQYEIDGHIVHLASKESATDRNFGAYLQEAPLPTLTIVSVPPATAIVDEVYRYDAKAIDSRGESLTWSILTGPEGMTIHPELGVLVWTPRIADLGATYQVVVSVKNESGLTSAQTFSVDVSTPNRPPVLLENRFPVPAFAESEYVYQILAADPDGDALTYVIDPQFYGQAPEGLTLDRETGIISWIPTVDQIGDHVLAFAVLDERGSYVRASVTLTVAQRRPTTEVDSDPHPVEQNTPPQWLTTSIPAAAYVGASYSATFEAFDPDGDAITYSFDSELGGAAPEGMTIDPATGVISWTPTLEQIGSQPFTVVALDARGAYARATASITVVEQIVDEPDLNEPPEILSEPATYALTSTEYVYAPSIVDPNGDALAVSLVAAPEGMAYDPETGKITWTPSDDLAGETISVLLKAEDPSGAYATQSWDIAVYVSYVNQPPVLFSDPASYPYSTGLTVVLGNTYEYNLLAIDPDGDSMFCTLETAPSGMLVDQAQGSMPVLTSFDSIGSDGEYKTVASLDARVFWTPTANDLGVHPVTVAVADAAGNIVRQSFEIVVNSYNLPPQVTSSAPVGVYAGDEYVYPVVAFDPEGEPLTFDLINAPSGMTVDSETGLVRWLTTGSDVGDYQFDVLVSDGYNITGVHYNFAVVEKTTVDETGNHAPDILSEPGQYGAIGDLYSYDVVAVDPDGDELTYSLESAPQGAAIDSRTGALRWTPTANQVGMTNFVVVVSDSHGFSAKQEYNFLVREANTAPVITSTPRDYVYTRALYSYDVSAYDPDGDAIFYAIEEGPDGATVDANGRFRWTADAAVGERSVVISATDSRGNKTTQEWTLSVEAQGPAIQIVADEETYPAGKNFTYCVSLDSRVGIKTATVTMTAVDGSSSNSNTIRRSATMTANVAKSGDYEIRVVATDVDGVTSVATKTITCSGVDPSAPIADVTSPDVEGDEVLIQKVTDIVGDIYDPDGDMEYWTVSIGAYGLDPDQENGWRLLYREDKDPNSDEPLERRAATLYRFDPSLFADGWYTIRVKGYDARQNSGGVTIDVFVLADSDWANFSFAFTDLNVQTSSIPFVMTRGYDTKLTAQDGEFGYGWTHTFRSLQIQTNVKSPDGESFGMYEPFYYGSSKIMVTLPDGSKDVFNFKLGSGTNAANGTYEAQAYGIMGVYSPSFECATDSGATLTLDGSFQFQLSKLRIMDDGACYSWGMQKPYNPFDPEINTGFTYTTKDGIKYHIDSQTLKTDSVTDTCGNKLVFSGDEVFDENDAKVVTFTRDFHDRITSITLADGRSVSYTYDKIGNLSSFTGLDGQTIQYKYYDTVKDKEHYIRSIIDADGNEALKLQYDEFGRVTGLADVSGAGIAVSYDSDNFVRTTTDQLGNTTVETLDEYGNVIKTVTPEGGVTTATYDELGNQLSETTIVYNPDGSVFTELTTKATYNSQGNVSSDTDIYGNVTNYTYDKYGQIASTSVNGITTSTKYNSKTGAPISDTDEYGNVTTFDVDADGNVKSLTNESGDVLLGCVYDGAGNVVQSVVSGARTTYNSYDSRGNIIEEWYFEGSTKVLDKTAYDDSDRVVGTQRYIDGKLLYSTQKTYNSAGLVVSETDRNGMKTETQYDPLGRAVQTRRQALDASGSVVWFVSRNVYDAKGQTLATTDSYIESANEEISGTTVVYDKDGRVVRTARVVGMSVEFDEDGYAVLANLGTELYAEGTTYNNAGWTMAETDRYGLKTTYSYDKFGNVVETAHERVDENGEIITLVSRAIYDSEGRVWLQTSARPDSAVADATRTEYDAHGNVVSTEKLTNVKTANLVNLSGTKNYRSALVSAAVTSSSSTVYVDGVQRTSVDQLGGKTTFEYDSLGRLTRQTTPDGIVNTYVYNDAGLVAEQTSSTANETRTEKYEYDYADRLIKTTYDDGTTFQSTYDEFGNLTSETNREGQIKRYEYDSVNRLTAVVIAVGTNAQARYEYEYDADGNRTVIRDAMGRETRYEYDAQGNVLSRTLPLGFGADGVAGTADDAMAEAFTERFEYDELGRTARAVSFEGVVTRYEYDAFGRLAKTVFFASEADEAAGKVDSAYAYKTDVYGRVVETVETDSIGAQVRKETVAYADSGRVETVTASEGTVRYEHDAYDRLTRTSSDKGDDVFYAYDALGRLATVRDAAHDDLTTTYSYDAFGNLAKTAISTGVTTTYEYDASNRLVKTTNFVDSNADGVWNGAENRISQFEYAYDALGQKTSSIERFGNGDSQTIRTAWTYDAQNRLVEEVFDSYDDSLDQTLAWSYDLNGNRLTQTRDAGNDGTIDERTAYRYDANDRLIQEAFDSNGDGLFEETIDYSWLKTQQTGKTISENETVKSQTTYAYNALGLTSEVLIVENGATTRVRYEYDAQGIRVASTVEVDSDGDGTFEKSTRTEFLNDGNNQTGYSQSLRKTETDNATGETTTTSYTIGLDQIVQTIVAPDGTESKQIFTYDGRGSVRVLTNFVGTVLETYSYDAFGNALGFNPANASTDYLFDGELFDSVTGLLYLRARDYDPAVGRFTSFDPFYGDVNDPQSLHKYAFTANNPINFNDPSGEFFGLASIMTGMGNVATLEIGVIDYYTFMLTSVAPKIIDLFRYQMGIYEGNIANDLCNGLRNDLVFEVICTAFGFGLHGILNPGLERTVERYLNFNDYITQKLAAGESRSEIASFLWNLRKSTPKDAPFEIYKGGWLDFSIRFYGGNAGTIGSYSMPFRTWGEITKRAIVDVSRNPGSITNYFAVWEKHTRQLLALPRSWNKMTKWRIRWHLNEKIVRSNVKPQNVNHISYQGSVKGKTENGKTIYDDSVQQVINVSNW